MFDIVFISYNEPNADANWDDLKSRFPLARRVHGVKGIHKAHQIAAKTSLSTMFWVVDGDSRVDESFKFENPEGLWEECVYVYRARNPVNDLSYGYGGLKLLPTKMTVNMDMNNVDMTTSISKNFTAVDQIASTTCFNTDAFSSWKSAFRECVKLSSKVIDGQVSKETELRLDRWCSIGLGKPFGKECIKGAVAGRTYGQENAGNIPALAKINDFEWLKDQFARKGLVG